VAARLYPARGRSRECRVGATHHPHTVCGGFHPPYKWLTSARVRYKLIIYEILRRSDRGVEAMRHSAKGTSVSGRRPRTNGASSDGVTLTFNELVHLLEENGFVLIKEKGSVRYYSREGWVWPIRVDYHGEKEVPTGTCRAILKAAGIRRN
jgi:predicted RNA binding protein YcfA (HicA-like mRNA interferase family)